MQEDEEISCDRLQNIRIIYRSNPDYWTIYSYFNV